MWSQINGLSQSTLSTKTSQDTQIIVPKTPRLGPIRPKSCNTPLTCLLTLSTKTSQVYHITEPKLPRSHISECQNFPSQLLQSAKTSPLGFPIFSLVFIYKKLCKTMRSWYIVRKSAENGKLCDSACTAHIWCLCFTATWIDQTVYNIYTSIVGREIHDTQVHTSKLFISISNWL
jgi:hypothetical protein